MTHTTIGLQATLNENFFSDPNIADPKTGSIFYDDSPKSVTVLPGKKAPSSAIRRSKSRATAAAAVGIGKAPKRLTPSEITTFACNVLEMSHAFRELDSMHDDPKLLAGFLSNKHIYDPRYAKMQRTFNSLKERAVLWGDSDPRITILFKLMIHKVTTDPKGEDISSGMKHLITDFIGKENIVSAGPFEKFGVICIKDSALINPRPINIVTESELEEMTELRSKLRSNEADNKVSVFGSKEFKEKTLDNFDKLLTFPEGRELVKQVYATDKFGFISEGVPCEFGNQNFIVKIDHENHCMIGTEGGKTGSVLYPSWPALAHELIHAIHGASGNKEAAEVDVYGLDLRWTNAEEFATINGSTGVTENKFLANTMHPPRKFHTPGSSPHTDTLMTQIDIALHNDLDADFERILQEEVDIPAEELTLMIHAPLIRRFSHLKMLALNHPQKEEFISPSLLFYYLESSIARGHKAVIQKILLDYPEIIKNLNARQKRILLMKAIKHSPKLASTFIQMDFHKTLSRETFTKEDYSTALSKALKANDHAAVQSLLYINATVTLYQFQLYLTS